MKKWYLSKTVWVNALIMLIGIIDNAAQLKLIDPEKLIFIGAIANLVLRTLTKTELS